MDVTVLFRQMLLFSFIVCDFDVRSEIQVLLHHYNYNMLKYDF